MEMVSVEYKYKLENNNTRIVAIKDVNPMVSEAEILALGNSLIQKKGHYKGSKFVSLLGSTKVVTTRETF
ncbi:MAG: hypothetical protein FWC47_03845 [Oscillospiraceae bacterium]|nr:hypothetical protein [Oscillospiraceae bacterium]